MCSEMSLCLFLQKEMKRYTMKIAKKVERFYASARAIYTDSVSPSSVDHRCAVGKFAPRKSVVGESVRSGALH